MHFYLSTSLIQASFLEIYNEEIRDLLATEKNLKYDIKMTDAKGSDVYVTNLNVSSLCWNICHLGSKRPNCRSYLRLLMNIFHHLFLSFSLERDCELAFGGDEPVEARQEAPRSR